MRHVAFVVPFKFETSVRFLRAALRLPDVAIGLISQDPPDRFDADIRQRLKGYVQVPDALDAQQLADAVRRLSKEQGPIDRLLGVLEQLQVPLAEAREALGLPGLSVEAAHNFRDKALMKDRLRDAGIPCARHRRATSAEEVRSFVNEVGFPIIMKPTAGAGAQNTFRLDHVSQLSEALGAFPPNPAHPMLLEEFILGEEHSFDAVTVGGECVWHSISRYSPGPLEVMENEWIQWCVLLPRHIDGPRYDAIRDVGPRALRALGLDSGLAHMEWFRRKDGTIAISEVGARPPGAQFTTLLSHAHETDMYADWSRLAITDEFTPPERRWSIGAAYLRGQGSGKVAKIHGLEQAQREFGPMVVDVKLPRAGQAKSSSYEGEGYVILRHEETRAVADALTRLVQMIRVEPPMNVLMLSPGYPDEMVQFTEGLAAVGARVFGVGEAPPGSLPTRARESISAYLQVRSLWNEDDAIRAIVEEVRSKSITIDRVECLWEPLMILAARLREALGVEGMTVAETVPFRDKEEMKRVLDEAGLRTPRHAKCATPEECREAAERIGFPLIVKPIAGAGSADTYRCGDAEELEEVLTKTAHVPEVSVEEYIEGEEYTFDTVCHDGRVAFYNISWYRPRPLIGRTVQWISPQTMTLRNVEHEDLAGGRELGFAVLKALGFKTGFTHMEWFRTPSGEAVFGEIGCRPPGARTVEIMNVASDIDLYRGWAEATCLGRFTQPIERRYNSAIIFKRAVGEGRIRRITGLESLLHRYAPHILSVDLLPVGARRRNWKATLMSDGHVVVRHPDLASCMEIADRVGTDLQLYAG